MKKETLNEHNNTMSHNNESHSKSSELLHQEKWNLASALDDKNLTLEDIRNSIKIDDEWDVMKVTKSVINRIWFNKELYNTTFINAHWPNGDLWIGFRKADNLLKVNPQDKIVLYSVMPQDVWIYSMVFSLSDLLMIKSCLENPNFVIVDAIWNLDFSDVKFWEGYNKQLYEWICKYIQSRKYEYIWTIRHRLRIRSSEVDVNKLVKMLDGVDMNELFKLRLKWDKLALELYNDYNSLYWPCTFEEFIETITDDEWYKEWVDIMEWRKLLWVYCDIDDTLIIRDKNGFAVNEKVLNYLKEQEKLWREIHIWTWWNISDQQQKLNKFWIKYPLMSKYEHRWAEAEIVIDDQDYGSFMSDYWIKAKNYINVYDL